MIRVAKLEDYPDMDKLFRLSANQLCQSVYTSEQLKSWAGRPWPERFMRNSSEGHQQYVMTRERRVICFGIIDVMAKNIVALFVHPKYSGQNIGHEMMKFLLQQAAERQIDSLTLDSSLNAVNFYRRHGFSEIGRSTFTTQNGTNLESVQMIKHLDSK
ncbi:GNAT family N-acetyltransferase [Thalassotalea mangrovi]|uniref:GNAT family N-acetyltransferase n=1 Tax=Thalassotalea mangrovi TaxID=2572245 RepID=A0A4U1B2P2_9GAMM|nr:GNAT family N-acetyltransferase [Thalassotalea mangrovi]TKB44005.1 GNAT family N-acetyltransferase [Thalassotalea mangrovi]